MCGLGVMIGHGLVLRPAMLGLAGHIVWMPRARRRGSRCTAMLGLPLLLPLFMFLCMTTTGIAARLAMCMALLPLPAATAARLIALLAAALPLPLSAPLPLQYRLGFRVRIRRKTGDHFLRNVALDQPLDVAQEYVLIDAYQ